MVDLLPIERLKNSFFKARTTVIRYYRVLLTQSLHIFGLSFVKGSFNYYYKRRKLKETVEAY